MLSKLRRLTTELVLTDKVQARSGSGLYLVDDGDNGLFIADGGNVFLGDTSNAKMTKGLTINQGAADDEILALKSSDVAHGMTNLAETDTYGVFKKASAPGGGLSIHGLHDSEAGSYVALQLAGKSGTTASTTKSTSGLGLIDFIATQASGAGETSVGADGNLVTFRNWGTTRFIFDAEGSGHSDVEWTTYQEHNDLALIGDIEQELLTQENEAQINRRYELERLGIIGKDSWHIENGKLRAMVNFTKLAMLHHGALIQIAEWKSQLEKKLEIYEQMLLSLGVQPRLLEG